MSVKTKVLMLLEANRDCDLSGQDIAGRLGVTRAAVWKAVKALKDEGYEIVGEASNGQEAFALTQELCPHIVICDIVMPVLDGVDFSQLIHENYPNIQLIILSGYDKFEYVKNTLMNGAVDYILKPTLTPDGMRSTLKKASERIPG